MVVDVDVAVVEPGEEPGFSWVEVDALDAVGALEEFALLLSMKLVNIWRHIVFSFAYVDVDEHYE